MSFSASSDPSAPALIDAATGATLTYGELDSEIEAARAVLPAAKSLALVALANSIPAVVAYLAARAAGHAVMVVDPGLPPPLLERLVGVYRPEVVYRPAGAPAPSYRGLPGRPGLYRGPAGAPSPLHPDLALLLSTSGSTGNPKAVRLSSANLDSNVAAIAASLDLDGRERAVTSLPLSYTYGLSVLHTHLAVGAAVVVTAASVLEGRFWDAVREHGVTSLAGVPYTYRILERIGFRAMDLPKMTKMTQAGGKLADDMILLYSEHLAARGGRFYVMYGQTEASPRMTCLAPDQLPARVGSVGRPLAGGRLEIRTPEGAAAGPGEQGEVVYRGPNVMMGYAEVRDDLSAGDGLGGELATGDLGYVDTDGYLWLTGRSRRIAKLFGARVSLDDVEAAFRGCGAVAATAGEDSVVVHHEGADRAVLAAARRAAAKELRIPPSAIELVAHPAGLPTGPRGKVDYRSLEQP